VDTQQQFFSITHPFTVSVDVLALGSAIPNNVEFEQMMPPSFRLASQISAIETSALRPLKHLGEHASDLSEFLNAQAKKIDLMMSYILTLDDGVTKRLDGTSFGGSHFTYISNETIQPDQLIAAKVFIDEGNCAIFSIARVISCTVNETTGEKLINATFVKISDDAQEQLVRTSLHVQTLQLKERSESRKLNDTDDE